MNDQGLSTNDTKTEELSGSARGPFHSTGPLNASISAKHPETLTKQLHLGDLVRVSEM